MRFIPFALACLLLSSLPGFSPADGQPDKDQPQQGKKASGEKINHLVKQLGDDAFTKREQARKHLEEIGEPAIAILKTAAAHSDDAEIRRAAKAIVEAFEQKHSGLLRVFDRHGNRVNGVAISADGKRALSATKRPSWILFPIASWVAE